MFCLHQIPLTLTMALCSLPSSVAFLPAAAAAFAPPAVAAAPAVGTVFSDMTRSQSPLQRLQAHRHRRDSLTLNPRANRRRPIAMAWPDRKASVALFVAGMVFGCCISSPVSANFRLYRTVPDIPKSMFQDHASLKGTVVSVSDGDSIRARHIPNVPLPLPGRSMEGKKRSEQTLQIRLYGIDCPEVAHFGNPAQPFSEEAKAFTRDALEGKSVKIKLLRLDQYNRAVSRVQYGMWPFRKDISAELLKNGLCVVYRQGGAEYDGREKVLTEYENSAKSRKQGLWSRSGGETPAQYKARMKREQPVGAR